MNDFDPVNDENSNRSKRRRTIPSYFNDNAFVLDQDARVIQEETPGSDSPRDLFRRDFFFPFLDWMHNELERRFSSNIDAGQRFSSQKLRRKQFRPSPTTRQVLWNQS